MVRHIPTAIDLVHVTYANTEKFLNIPRVFLLYLFCISFLIGIKRSSVISAIKV